MFVLVVHKYGVYIFFSEVVLASTQYFVQQGGIVLFFSLRAYKGREGVNVLFMIIYYLAKVAYS